jgi:mannosyltransferase
LLGILWNLGAKVVYWLVPAKPAEGIRLPVWLPPIMIMFALGLWRISRPGMWADELATWGAARMALGDMLRMLREVDAVDALYYLLMNGWIRLFGDSEFAMRFPSLLAITATAGLLAVLGRRLISYRVGMIAGLAFTVVPAASRYAQEARVYPFVILLAVIATLLVDRLSHRPATALERPGVGRRVWPMAGPKTTPPAGSQDITQSPQPHPRLILFVGYAVTVAVMGLLHLLAVLIVAAHGVAMLWHVRRPECRPILWRWAIAAGCGVLPVLPLAWLSTHQQGQVSWIPESGVRSLIGLPEKLTSSAAVGGFLVALAVLAISKRWSSLLVLSWIVVPPAVLFLASYFTELFWYRYLLFTLPALVLAAGITLARGRLIHIVAGLVALAAFGVTMNLFYRWPDGHEHDTRGVAKIISANFRPGDAIAYALHEPVVPWEARDVVARYVSADKRPRDAFARVPQRGKGNFLAEECPDSELAQCLGDAPRVWVIRFESRADPLAKLTNPVKEKLLRDNYRLEQAWTPRAFSVAVYAKAT